MKRRQSHPFKVGQMYKKDGMKYQFLCQKKNGSLHFVRFDDSRKFDYTVDAAKQMFGF